MNVANTYHVGTADIKVYTGIVALPDPSEAGYAAARERAALEVAHSGTPERFNRAVTYFPGLTADSYAS